MTALSPYGSLEVIETYRKTDGYRAFVRDEEHSHLFVLVEYVDRRLVCYCPGGVAHAESPTTEPPCAHLTAVCDERMATQQSSRPRAAINTGSFCD